MDDRVLSLTTVGTPHRGTRVRRLGRAAVRRGSSPPFLRLLGHPARGVLRPDDRRAAGGSTRTCRTRRGCGTSRSPGCASGRGSGRSGGCRAGSSDRAEGPNDGVVSVASATWGEHTEVWAGDHLNLVNWPNRPACRRPASGPTAPPTTAGCWRGCRTRGLTSGRSAPRQTAPDDSPRIQTPVTLCPAVRPRFAGPTATPVGTGPPATSPIPPTPPFPRWRARSATDGESTVTDLPAGAINFERDLAMCPRIRRMILAAVLGVVGGAGAAFARRRSRCRPRPAGCPRWPPRSSSPRPSRCRRPRPPPRPRTPSRPRPPAGAAAARPDRRTTPAAGATPGASRPRAGSTTATAAGCATRPSIGEGCANPVGCGSCASEKTFLFGGCNQFFNAGNKCGGRRVRRRRRAVRPALRPRLRHRPGRHRRAELAPLHLYQLPEPLSDCGRSRRDRTSDEQRPGGRSDRRAVSFWRSGDGPGTIQPATSPGGPCP